MRRVGAAGSCLLTSAIALFGCSPSAEPAPARTWSVVEDNLDRVPLCVFGTAPDDVWIGGGGLKSVSRTLLLHGGGQHWSEVEAPSTETIWWIHGVAADDLWAVGESGLALHWDGAAWSRSSTGTAATLYGVWAASAQDVWAVGGSSTGTGDNDVLLHFDGSTWTSVAPPRVLGATYFKVWGLSASDVHVVASGGLALHYDGTAWSQAPTDTTAPLFTVHGGALGVHAIGGPPPTLLAWDGSAWQEEMTSAEMSGSLTGIFLDGSGTLFVTGERYQRFERDRAGTFTNDTDHPPLFGDLHSVWGDGKGNAIAVGGNYVALTRPSVAPMGIIVSYGP